MKRIIICLCMLLVMTASFACKKKNTEQAAATNKTVNETNGENSVDTGLVEEIDDSKIYDLAQGMKMPNVKVETNKGTTFELNKTNKPVFINFWATWCPPCRMEMPGLQSLYEEYRDKVDFVMINLGETRETIEDFLVENELYTFPIGYDVNDTFGARFGIIGIPTTYIIDKNKVISNYVVGARDESQFREYLEEVIKKGRPDFSGSSGQAGMHPDHLISVYCQWNPTTRKIRLDDEFIMGGFTYRVINISLAEVHVDGDYGVLTLNAKRVAGGAVDGGE